MRYNLRLLLILLAIAPPLLAWGYRIATDPVAEEPVAELGDLAEPYDTLIIKTAAEVAEEQAEWEEEKRWFN